MAPSSKKNGRSAEQRTRKGSSRVPVRKPVSKRKKSRKKNKSGSKRIWKIIAVFLGMVLLVGVGYCLGRCWAKEETPVTKKKIQPTVKVEQKRVHKSGKKPSKSLSHPPKDRSLKANRYEKVKLAYRGTKPRLAIIIDDVHTKVQLDAVTSLPFPVTPSIFPPYSQSPDTHRLATQAVHYMIHLPMESGNKKYDRQSKTLKRNFSKKQIEARVHELRHLFPRAHYINNHTGSRFTEDRHAMQILYEAMKREGFTFIDSVTTGRSRVKEIAHHYGDAYVARDIFIDNRQDVAYIHGQLKKAIALAQKNGYAIAIGHPHKTTFEALRRAKPLLKEVEVVYIDALFRRY
jgi:polysaccharide deacetylase 2 family uncharacterized protein YibQ